MSATTDSERGPRHRATIGGPAAVSWREGALTRAAELEVLAEYFGEEPPSRELLAERIKHHLHAARVTAGGEHEKGRLFRVVSMLGGSPLERTASNIDAAESDLLRLAPNDYVRGQMPSLLAKVRRHLAVDDPRRVWMEELAMVAHVRELTAFELNIVVAALRAANSEARREVTRVRSFRNVLYLATGLMTIALTGLTLLAILRPDVVPMCFTPPTKVVCATSEVSVPQGKPADPIVRDQANAWDILTVEIVGLIAALVASAIALRNIRGTTTPYSLPVALTLLKLPTGAVTAILGLLLMRGGFVPGLSALDTPAQILSWAVIFGYSQQVFTRFADERAHAVLDQVGSTSSTETRLNLSLRDTPHPAETSNGGQASGGEGPKDGAPPDGERPPDQR
jgi:hypothetical protein